MKKMNKNLKKVDVMQSFNTAIDTTKKTAKKANEFALNTTEDVVLETISIVGQWQKVGKKAIKGSLKLISNQQDLVFNSLEMIKGQAIQSKKRFSKLFA